MRHQQAVAVGRNRMMMIMAISAVGGKRCEGSIRLMWGANVAYCDGALAHQLSHSIRSKGYIVGMFCVNLTYLICFTMVNRRVYLCSLYNIYF